MGLTQAQRFITFILNTGIFYALYVIVNGRWYITGGGESVWLGAAIAAWTLSLLSAPWYRPPRDALAAGVAAAIALLAIDLSSIEQSKSFVIEFRYLALAYIALVMGAALVAAFTDDTTAPRLNRLAYDVAERLSNGTLIFATVAAISIFGFYEDEAIVLTLSLAWMAWALVRPVEAFIVIYSRWQSYNAVKDAALIGTILRVDDPDVIRVAIDDLETWSQPLQVAYLPGGITRYSLPLFYHSQDDNLVGTALLVGQALDRDTGPSSAVFVEEDEDKRDELLVEIGGQEGDFDLVGFVVEGSTIAEIRFEIAKQTKITEGSVVFCRVRDKTIYYQIMDANTMEESFQQNPRGTHIVSAAQLGTWDNENGFQKFDWLPLMNAPVFLQSIEGKADLNFREGEFEIGKVPNSHLAIKADLAKLINYHTAVLGVTGTGKTELVFSLIEEAIKQGTKVICVDLTGEYRKRLAHLQPQAIGLRKAKADEIEEAIFNVSAGEYRAGAEKRVLKELVEKSRDDARNQVEDFLRSAGSALGLFELAEVTNTRATLIATEMYLSEIMRWARSHRKSRRILIVLEEAHTIIPETTGSGFDFDTQSVVAKIGQIALQGRKYGVGLLIVSQRTALVSKTVLSQCNTFFTHSLIDQTSLGFLLNIYESSYVRAIPNLKFLQFIASGQGVVSERPVLLRRPFDQRKADASEELDEYEDIDKEIPTQTPEGGSGPPAVNGAVKAAPEAARKTP